MPFDIGGFVYNTAFIQDYTKGGIVTDGLVLHLDAAYGNSYPKGGTTWYDLSGNGNNGTLTNGPTYNSGNGGSIVFDGSNDDVSINNLTLVNNPSSNNMNISANFWCKVNTSSSYYILASGSQTSSTGISFSYQAGSPFVFVKGTNTFAGFYFSNTIFPLNEWINWCFTSNGTNLILYKNGLQVAIGSFTNQTQSTLYTNFTIGRPNSGSGFYASINFSNLQIYNRALSSTEITQNYNATKSRFGL